MKPLVWLENAPEIVKGKSWASDRKKKSDAEAEIISELDLASLNNGRSSRIGNHPKKTHSQAELPLAT